MLQDTLQDRTTPLFLDIRPEPTVREDHRRAARAETRSSRARSFRRLWFGAYEISIALLMLASAIASFIALLGTRA